MRATLPLLSIVVFSLVLLSACSKSDPLNQDELLYQQGSTPVMTGIACLDSMPFARLSAAEQRAMAQVRKFELMAYDVCMTFNNPNRQELFDDVAPNENRQANLALALFTRYSINDPCPNHSLGVFTDTAYQNLYNRLVYLSQNTYLNALLKGAMLEELEISRLNDLSNNVDQRDLAWAFNHMEKQSRNNLRMFYNEIIARGGSYSPHYLTWQYFNRIVTTGPETGPACP